VGDAGSEPSQEYSSFEPSPKILAQITALVDDPEFIALVDAWPTLSDATKAEIVALVATAQDASHNVE
jgi:hypothetical protein